jgi:glycosyltransferase involved in cell wall biosynthesis
VKDIAERTTAPLVLHVVPSDLARGAQIHAALLRHRLDGEGQRHRLVLLFGQERSVTQADELLCAAPGLGRRVGFSAVAAVRLARLVRQSQPEVLVAHGGEALKYVCSVPGSPVRVYHRIGSTAAGISLSSRLLYAGLARRVDHLVGVGHRITEEAANELHLPSARTTVIHNGRDATQFLAPSRGSGAKTRLLFVGHLTAGKRPDLFVALARELGHRVASTVVGDGPMLEHLQRDYPEIAFTGGRHDVASLMAEHDILVFPSLPEGEGLPGVLIEAAMSGLPIVTTDVPGADEVVTDGVTGIVVPHDDRSALLHGIETLVDDPGLRLGMGARAREHALQEFTIDRCVRSWRVLLDDLLASRTAHA